MSTKTRREVKIDAMRSIVVEKAADLVLVSMQTMGVSVYSHKVAAATAFELGCILQAIAVEARQP